jgi:CHASE2 domain-containing sensor protein
LIIAMVIQVDAARLRDQVFNLYQRLVPRQVDATPAIVVDIDDNSLAEIGAWP